MSKRRGNFGILRIAILVGLLAPAIALGAGSAPVTVVNTGANPVPVTGSLGVTGSVNVSNTAANPVPVTLNGSVDITSLPAGVEKFPKMNVFQGATTSNLLTLTISPTVPSGSVFVATNVSMVADVGNSVYPIVAGSCRLVFKDPIASSSTRIVTLVGGDNKAFYDEWYVNQPVTIVLKEGESLDADCVFSYLDNHASSIALSGSLGGYFQAAN